MRELRLPAQDDGDETAGRTVKLTEYTNHGPFSSVLDLTGMELLVRLPKQGDLVSHEGVSRRTIRSIHRGLNTFSPYQLRLAMVKKFKYDRSKTMEENWEVYSAIMEIIVISEDDEEKYNKKRLAFHKKYVTQGFQEHFGRDENALEGWRGICETLGISDAESFPTISRCKKVDFL
jgi:hypothetical protein